MLIKLSNQIINSKLLLVIIGYNLNSLLKLFFYPPYNNLTIEICESVSILGVSMFDPTCEHDTGFCWLGLDLSEFGS